jgi:hypothetical protein
MGIIAQSTNPNGGYVYGVCDPEYFGFPGTREIDTYQLITTSLGEPPGINTSYEAAIWCAIFNITLDQVPTLYQGVYPKYQIGTWAQLNSGIVVADGFINYTIQRLCSGIQPLDRETYAYYNGVNYPEPPPEGGFDAVWTPLSRMTSYDTLPTTIQSDGISISGNSSGEGTVQIYYYALYGTTQETGVQYIASIL